MKTPILDEKIKILEEALNSGIIHQGSKVLNENELHEYKAIKKQLENNPIVSTPDNPVWVVDECGKKRILLADLGLNVIDYRFITVNKEYEPDFLAGKPFDYDFMKNVTPYTEKVSIEVTQDEASKVEEFLKNLRNGR